MHNGDREGLIYKIDADVFDDIPNKPGVYVFARKFADSIEPLYIGQASRLAFRIRTQLNNLRLMKGIKDANIGHRILLFAQLHPRPGQQIPKSLTIIETALIENAMTEGHRLLNKLGVKPRTHELTFRGCLKGRKTFPRVMYVRAR